MRVVDEAADSDLVPEAVFAEGKRLADEGRTALAQRVVTPLDMRRAARFFANGRCRFGGNTAAYACQKSEEQIPRLR